MKRTILIVDDEQNMQTVVRMILEDSGHQVLIAQSAEHGLEHLQDPNLDVILTDLKMPGMSGEEFVGRCRKERPDVPVIVITAHGTIKSAVTSIHAGATDYLVKPFEPEALEISVHNALKLRDILRENQQLKAAVKQALPRRNLIGKSPIAQRLLEEIKRVAPVKSNILITGESGTGKEIVARAIHDLGPRKERPWVPINCSAIPHDLLESELFGYVKGAFSGATQNRVGRIEQAQGGTLFLDEIGDLDVPLQAKLLRVLQEREYSPLGSNQVRTVDFRLIAASNRNLKELAVQGQFREDLLYRLDVYSLAVPPLRERLEDIPLLAEAFLQELGAEMDRSVRAFSPDALEILRSYSWPGNIRELRNTVERSLLSCKGAEIGVEDLPQTILNQAGPRSGHSYLDEVKNQDLDAWLADLERRIILEALDCCSGVQAHAAKRLGISERSLWHRIKKLQIQIHRTFA